MANDRRMDDDHQQYIPGVQEKTTLGGKHNTGVTSSDPAEKELIEKQGNFAKIKPQEENTPPEENRPPE